jgi:hypothetical protein
MEHRRLRNVARVFAPAPTTQPLDSYDPDFEAACLEVARVDDRQLEPNASEPEAVISHDQPEAERLREVPSDSHDQVEVGEEVLRENDVLRRSFARLNAQHADDKAALEDAVQREVQAQADLAGLHHRTARLERLLAERDSEIADLRNSLLDAERARAAEATSMVESLNQVRLNAI